MYRRGVAVDASQQGSVELRSFVERYLAAWNGCDTDGMAQLITEDIVWADPALPEPARGVQAVQDFMCGAIDPPGFAPTGRNVRVEGIDQWTMRDGRIARYRAFYDMNDLARQLGIVPAAGSGAERGMVALQRLQARFSRR